MTKSIMCVVLISSLTLSNSCWMIYCWLYPRSKLPFRRIWTFSEMWSCNFETKPGMSNNRTIYRRGGYML